MWNSRSQSILIDQSARTTLAILQKHVIVATEEADWKRLQLMDELGSNDPETTSTMEDSYLLLYPGFYSKTVTSR